MRTGRFAMLAAGLGLLAVADEAAGSAAPADPPVQMIAPGPGSQPVVLARSGAARRLGTPACAQVFTDFADASGRPLQERLDAFGLSGPDYLSLIFFSEGLDDGRCGEGRVLATAVPGSRRVAVCRRFAHAYRRNPRWAELILIHEALHTLGLREDPPSSAVISARVAARCGG